MNDEYILYHNLKELDLHGLNRYEAAIALEGFILEQYKLGTKYISIIHGKTSGIIKKTTYIILKKNKHVKDFKINLFNSGQTIAELQK